MMSLIISNIYIHTMTFLKYWMEIMDLCYFRVMPDDDEITRDNTDDTILPPDFIPVNEAQHQNPFRTLSPLASF